MGPAYRFFKFPEQFFDIFDHSSYELSISKEDARRKGHLKYLVKYLTEIGCQSILVENEYIDHDYLDDYTSYYAKCFVPYKRFCQRAHFFKQVITEGDLEQSLVDSDNAKIDQVRSSYIGFTVFKPLPQAVVGRTIVDTYPPDDGRRVFPVKKKYNINLFGLRLEKESLAFQEQDTVLAACATTALWSAFQKASDLYQTHIPTPAEITKCATRYVQTTRPIPTHGLNPEQMCNAISELGLAPEVSQIRPDTPLRSLVYGYVASGVPVLLGYNINGTDTRHAVTVCGFRLEDIPTLGPEAQSPDIHLSLVGQRIKELYVHDDNLGPFSRLEYVPPAISGVQPSLNPCIFKRDVFTDSGVVVEMCIPEIVIVPVYHKVRLTFNAIKGAIRDLDKYFFDTLQIGRVGSDDSPRLEWDIRLMELPEVKDWAQSTRHVNRDMVKEILFSNLPRYNWICTVRAGDQDLFSIIADATDMERSFYLHRVLFHVAGVKDRIAGVIRDSDLELENAAAAFKSSDYTKFLTTWFLS